KTNNTENIKQSKKHQHGIVINLAGKQRMLTQKMSKEALLIAKGINVKNNTESLKKTIALFDKTLIGLRNGDKSLHLPKTNNQEIVKQIDKVVSLWNTFKIHVEKVADGKTEKATLVSIDKENLPLLRNMNMVVQMYENDGASHLDPHMAKTINLAGRQRMLTQKMTKELLLIANKLKSNANVESLKSTGELFKDTLTNLMTNNREAMTDPDIAKRLVTVQTLWSEYQNVIANTGISEKEQQASKKQQNDISQKMTKELLTIANRVDAKEYTKNLQKTGELFDKTLIALIKGDTDLGLAGTKDEAINRQLVKVQKLWLDYKEIISNADVSEKGLEKAIAINIPLLTNMNKAVKMYEESVK
ncbi:hypothetical protein GSY74_01040, partial [Sulfurovum sp. bin170]|uniref:type IV pili methyl-accepting chemotaxis transducer N-terminal domain-containing protein n=1 Tax=Sulfurovum sp. bin170 TaxID=2695268 RepID=UPI0013DF32C0